MMEVKFLTSFQSVVFVTIAIMCVPSTKGAKLAVIDNNVVNNDQDSTMKYSYMYESECDPKIAAEIAQYSQVIQQIFNYTVQGEGKGVTFNELAKFVDKFGPRIAGSQNLENAIDYALDLMQSYGVENVHTEPAIVPHWVRGKESARMVKPRVQNLAMMGLGGTIGTPVNGISGNAIVVKSFDELKTRAAEVPGKIVVFNEDFVSYGVTVKYRSYSSVEVAKLGGIAALVRSITPYSINSPHTGWQDYADNVTQIPVACITIEDAEMLYRMDQRGDEIVIEMNMEAKNYPPVMSRNSVGELTGNLHPDQVVLVSGHLDSWDVGQGAMDDGGGAFISWRALSVLKKLGLRPKRTMRAVLWTGEEEGLWGAQAYFNGHRSQNDNFSIVMESDIGTFTPRGLTYSGTNEKAKCTMKTLLQQFGFMNASQIDYSEEGSDTTLWMQAGVPGASLINDNQKYFYYHHSNGDTMTVEDAHTLDLCTAFWAATAYVIADLNDMLPR